MVKQSGKKPRVGDGTPGPGRKKGVPNKVTGDVKAMVLEALKQAGGVDYLVAQSGSNSNAFLALVGKVLPLTLSGDPAAPLKVTWLKS